MRGDIILYKSTGQWYERAIVTVTSGPYVHVAIAISETEVVAAGSKGIARFPYTYDEKIHTVISVVPTYTTQENAEKGLTWAMLQVGHTYGWVDIVYQGIKFLAPNNTLQLTQAGRWDCSDFATRYLQHAEVNLPDMFDDPYANTPNDLARWSGVLAPRKNPKTPHN